MYNYAMGLEQLAKRKSRRAKQRRRALIEPAKIVGVENNVGGIAISKLDPYADTVYEHNQFSLKPKSALSKTYDGVTRRQSRLNSAPDA
jgi:hypothetical protein